MTAEETLAKYAGLIEAAKAGTLGECNITRTGGTKQPPTGRTAPGFKQPIGGDLARYDHRLRGQGGGIAGGVPFPWRFAVCYEPRAGILHAASQVERSIIEAAHFCIDDEPQGDL